MASSDVRAKSAPGTANAAIKSLVDATVRHLDDPRAVRHACQAYGDEPATTQDAQLAAQDPRVALTPLDWLPGCSTLRQLKQAALEAGFEYWLTTSGSWWRIHAEHRDSREVRFGTMGENSKGEPEPQSIWDASVVDRGVVELSFLGVRAGPFQAFVRIANHHQVLPSWTHIGCVPRTATIARLLLVCAEAGYDQVWRMDYPGNARWRWLPCPGCVTYADRFYLARSLGFGAIDGEHAYTWRAERVRPGCIRCVSYYKAHGYMAGPVIHLAHIETTLSGFVPTDPHALAASQTGPPAGP